LTILSKGLNIVNFTSHPIVESTSGTYADKDAPIRRTTIVWNHGLAEVMMSLIKHGIQIKQFQEYDFSHFNIFPNCGVQKVQVDTLGKQNPVDVFYCLHKKSKINHSYMKYRVVFYY